MEALCLPWTNHKLYIMENATIVCLECHEEAKFLEPRTIYKIVQVEHRLSLVKDDTIAFKDIFHIWGLGISLFFLKIFQFLRKKAKNPQVP